METPVSSSSDEVSDVESFDDSQDDYQCSICGNSGGNWVCCDTCDHWFHLKCVVKVCLYWLWHLITNCCVSVRSVYCVQ